MVVVVVVVVVVVHPHGTLTTVAAGCSTGNQTFPIRPRRSSIKYLLLPCAEHITYYYHLIALFLLVPTTTIL